MRIARGALKIPARMLRRNLAPLDTYLADAVSLDDDTFLSRYTWPMIVIPEPDPEVLAKIQRPETLVTNAGETAIMDPLMPKMVGASLDALILELRPRKGGKGDRMTLGRSPEADVVLIDESVSRIHAEITWDAGSERATLMDMGARNGTSVDSQALAPNGMADLVPGAIVAFGSLMTRFYSPRSFLAWLRSGAPRSGAAPAAWPERTEE